MGGELLEYLLRIEPKDIPLSEICYHPLFQPRVAQLVPARHWHGVSVRSTEHIDSLVRKLQSSEDFQLDPILIADINGETDRLPDGLYVVDGHHRFAAYSDVGRREIPCRILSMSYQDALIISKLANGNRRAMKMHEEQRLDAAWQWMIIVTEGGQRTLPKDASARKLSATFDVGKNTVQRMKQRLREVKPSDYDSALLAPETGWPRWKFTRTHRNPWLTYLAELPPNERIENEAKLFIGKFTEVIDKTSSEVRARAKLMLESDAAYESNRKVADLDYFLNFYE